MGSNQLTEVLDGEGVEYELLAHAHTETATAEADALGMNPEEVGKTLILVTPTENVRAVVAASDRLDLHKVRDLLGVTGKQLEMATEEALERDYPEFELGAVPPFGGSRRDRVIIDRRLGEREWLVCEAGSHEESLRIPVAALIQLTEAHVSDISQD